jgi:glycosyltransferase involved in cell wall biosynthesis
VTACYLRARGDEAYGLDSTAKRLGIDYVEITERHSLDPAIWPTLRHIVHDRRIDIVHAHDYKTDALALLLARADRVAAMTTMHGWSGHSRREKWMYYPADRRFARAFSRVIAVSSDIRDALIRTGTPASRIVTLLNGIDPHAFHRDPRRVEAARTALSVPRRAIAIGAVGRLEREKRFDLLIDAFASLRARRRDALLIIAGDGSQRAALEAQIKRQSLGTVVRLIGHHRDVIGLHHAIDLLVQSSHNEGTPNSLLEAMAMETPIVATDVGGTRDLLEGGACGRLVPAGSADALAEAMAAAIDDRGGDRVRAARTRVEGELSFERRTRRLEDIYEQIMKDGNPANAEWEASRWAASGQR